MSTEATGFRISFDAAAPHDADELGASECGFGHGRAAKRPGIDHT